MRTEELLKNIDAFVPQWEKEWQPHPKMLDFEEKKQALNNPTGRFMVWSHRGDTARYPQNSIEAIISACMMGVDVCEIDVRVSKDGIPVLVHDETLTKTTNFSDMAGKTVNGMTLPTSAYVSDWTLAELRCLRLRQGKGGTGAAVTDYLIPTLEEAVIVAKGRMFLYCDKLELEYDSTSRAFTRNDVADIAFPIFAKHEAWDTMVFIGGVGVSYGYYCINDLKTQIPESAGGLTPYYLAQLTTSSSDSWSTRADQLSKNNMPMIARFSGWEDKVTSVAGIDTFFATHSEALASIRDRVRLHADCYNYETAEAFSKLLSYGVNGAMVNDPLTACRFVANTYYNK